MSQPTPDTSLIPHFIDIVGIVGPLFGVIVALVAYAWRSMEKNIDRLETSLRDHAAHDIAVHDAIFQQLRDSKKSLDELKDTVAENKATLSRLEGEHDVYHGGNQ